LWSESIEYLRLGKTEKFQAALLACDYVLDCKGRIRRRSRRGSGTFGVLPTASLKKIVDVLAGLAQVPVPDPNIVEWLNLETRMNGAGVVLTNVLPDASGDLTFPAIGSPSKSKPGWSFGSDMGAG
jgi:hypothetical protein